MSMVFKAQQAINKTRETLDNHKKEERKSLNSRSTAKESKHLREINQVEVSDNILKALKSLPASSRRKLEWEIRNQLMNEQAEMKKLSHELTQNHRTIAKQEQELLESKQEYERRAKKADNLKDSLEQERRAMQEQITRLAAMRKDV
eukprot:508489_1